MSKAPPNLPVPASPVAVYDALAHLSAYYPDFEAWFWVKVVPGLADGTRRVAAAVVNGEIAGVALAKRTAVEAKLSTVWVADAYKGTGIGGRMILDACEWLGTDTPLMTVPEERMPEFAPILAKLGFVEFEVVEGLYRPGKKEHVFNGRISPLSA